METEDFIQAQKMLTTTSYWIYYNAPITREIVKMHLQD